LILVITTLVASSYQFPKISVEEYNKLFFIFKQEYFVSIFSTIAALSTAILTFLKPSEKSEEHRKIGLEYEKLRHELEKLFSYNLTESSIEFNANQIKEKWDSLNTKHVTQHNYNKSRKFVKKFGYPPPMSFII